MRIRTPIAMAMLAVLLIGLACNGPEDAPLEVTVRAEVVDAQDAPFEVTATAVRHTPDGEFAHEVRVGWEGDEPVMLEDARFSHHVEGQDGDLVTAGRGCSANWDEGSERVLHVCTDDLQLIQLEPGEAHDYPLQIWPELGPLRLTPGEHVVEEQVARWYPGDDPAGVPETPEGQLTIRLTYEVQ